MFVRLSVCPFSLIDILLILSDNTLDILFRLKTCMRELMHILYIHFKCKKVKSLIRGYFETFPTIVLYLFQVIDPNRLVQVVLCSFHAKKSSTFERFDKVCGQFYVKLHFVYSVLCPSTVSVIFEKNITKLHIPLNEVELKSYKGKTRDLFLDGGYK